MARATMQFKKGDTQVHTFSLPATSWSAGGTLFFTAKSAPDNDATDAAAVIDKSFSDSVVTDVTIDSVAHKKYTLSFVAADLADVSFSDGSKKKEYLGEFQWVSSGGSVSTFPGTDDFIKVIVYADIKRAVV